MVKFNRCFSKAFHFTILAILAGNSLAADNAVL